MAANQAMFHIRAVEPAEADAISAIAMQSKAYWGYSADFMAACEAELTYDAAMIESSAQTFIGAQAATALVGFYALAWRSSECCELEALFVMPEYIGKGAGRELLEHAKQQAVREGVPVMRIQGDPHAENFYRQAGARVVGMRESGSIAGRQLPLFEIAL